MLLNRLKKGDTIGIIAPSSKSIDNEDRINNFIKYFNQREIKVILGKTCNMKYSYLAGSDEDRINDLEEMFANKEINAIMALKGGYGASRIVDKIDYQIIKNNPKVFIGFSDITVFLNAIYKKTNIPTIHGQVGIFLGSPNIDNESINDLDKMLFEKQKNRVITSLSDKTITLIGGREKGILVGGNLSLLATLAGSDYEVDFTDKIVFIEEVSEQPYQIDRYLSSLRLNKTFEKAKGYVFGYFTDCNKTSKYHEDWETLDVIKDYVMKLNKPAMYNFSSGHEFPFTNIPIGVEVEIDTNKKTIKILEEIYKD